jgi:DNA-binding transcriptional regulator YiaG
MSGMRKEGLLHRVKGGPATTPHAEDCEEKAMNRVLEEYDATQLVGLRTIVCGAAILHDEEDCAVEVPRLRNLLAAAAVARCLMPIRLRGHEVKAIRKIMRCTLTELAKKMDERAAPETVSRWESDAQLMGGYAEKILRLVACEALTAEAPGVEYAASMIANLIVIDPWKADAGFEVPPIVLSMVRIKERSGSIIDAYDLMKKAA